MGILVVEQYGVFKLTLKLTIPNIWNKINCDSFERRVSMQTNASDSLHLISAISRRNKPNSDTAYSETEHSA